MTWHREKCVLLSKEGCHDTPCSSKADKPYLFSAHTHKPKFEWLRFGRLYLCSQQFSRRSVNRSLLIGRVRDGFTASFQLEINRLQFDCDGLALQNITDLSCDARISVENNKGCKGSKRKLFPHFPPRSEATKPTHPLHTFHP